MLSDAAPSRFTFENTSASSYCEPSTVIVTCFVTPIVSAVIVMVAVPAFQALRPPVSSTLTMFGSEDS